jgi:N-acetylglucosamine kinase-like BadF-type ATPase
VGIYLGIDGGGSKTSLVIGDEKSLVARAAADASNIIKVGESNAQESLRKGIEEVCCLAKITPSQITRTCIGVAGAGRLEISEIVRRILSQLVSGEIKVIGDMVIAHRAAFSSGPGVIVIAGTGSIAYGRNSAGITARAGGWGFAISDEGSGQWIGRTAISAALRAYDEDRNTTLPQSIEIAWGLASREELVMAANAVPQPDFAVLFPSVIAAAESEDDLAIGILQQAGNELAILAQIVFRRIFLNASEIPVAMVGGVFRNSITVRKAFENELRAGAIKVVLNETVVDPVNGALDLARQLK